MERQYYGRPEYDARSQFAGEEIRLSEKLSKLLELGDSGLRRKGLSPPMVRGWTILISRGIVPVGANEEEFEAHVQGIIDQNRK